MSYRHDFLRRAADRQMDLLDVPVQVVEVPLEPGDAFGVWTVGVRGAGDRAP